MFALLVALGCTPPPAAPVSPAATPQLVATPAVPEGKTSKCVEACLDSRQMEARAIEAIRADCEAFCATPTKIVDRVSALASLGTPTVVAGMLSAVPLPTGNPDVTGTAVVLDDGLPVWVTYAAPPNGWGQYVGKAIEVDGVVSSGPPDGPPPGGAAVIVEGFHLVPSGPPRARVVEP